MVSFPTPPLASIGAEAARYIASDSPLEWFRKGEQDRLAGEQRNLLREVGGLAASGNISGAAGAAFRGGDPSTAINISNWDTQRRTQALTMLREGAQRADTPERWAALVNATERTFGPEMVGSYRDFNSRPAALTALEQAELQLKQAQIGQARAHTDVYRQQANTAERDSLFQQQMFNQFGFGGSPASTPAAPPPPLPMPSSMPPVGQPAMPGIITTPPVQPPNPMAPAAQPPAAPGAPPFPGQMNLGAPPPPQAPPSPVQLAQQQGVPQASPGLHPTPAPAAPAAPLQGVSAFGPSTLPPPDAGRPTQAPAAAPPPSGQPQTLAEMVTAMTPQNRTAAMLLLMKKDYAELAKMIGGVTPGTEAVDREFAKEFAAWNAAGGYADVTKQLAQLGGARRELATNPNLTGPIVGSLPDWALAFANPRAVAVRERIEEVVQRNLRQILGAQFTEREGQLLIARAYNPRLSAQENAQRVQLLIQQIDAMAVAKESASAHFRQHGTLRGWQGRLPTVTDINLDEPADPNAPATPAGANTPAREPAGASRTLTSAVALPDGRTLPPGTKVTKGADGQWHPDAASPADAQPSAQGGSTDQNAPHNLLRQFFGYEPRPVW